MHVSFLDSALKYPQEPKRKESASHPSLPDRESVTGLACGILRRTVLMFSVKNECSTEIINEMS